MSSLRTASAAPVACLCGIRPDASLRELQAIAESGSCTCPDRLCPVLMLAIRRAEHAEHGAARAAGVKPACRTAPSWRRYRRGAHKGAIRRARHLARRMKAGLA